ncbi:MAG TPA: LiaF domain-containing protein [Gammaproteobacteria bacterium]
MVSVFSAGGRAGVWEVPEEIRVITLFGATDLDFSNARFTAKVTRVELFCLFGAVDIFVPGNVSTTVKTFCAFGAVENKVPATEDPDAPRLIVEGLVLFGAADAKIKRTVKERLLEFAYTIRAMFVDLSF